MILNCLKLYEILSIIHYNEFAKILEELFPILQVCNYLFTFLFHYLFIFYDLFMIYEILM